MPHEYTPENKLRLITIDPGAVHVGVAGWGPEYDLVFAEEMSPDSVQNLLVGYKGRVVVESFSLMNPGFKHGSKFAVQTIELIGAIKAYGKMSGFDVVEQAPAVRQVAHKSPHWNRIFYDKNPGIKRGNDHVRSAIAHGIYYVYFGKGKEN